MATWCRDTATCIVYHMYRVLVPGIRNEIGITLRYLQCTWYNPRPKTEDIKAGLDVAKKTATHGTAISTALAECSSLPTCCVLVPGTSKCPQGHAR